MRKSDHRLLRAAALAALTLALHWLLLWLGWQLAGCPDGGFIARLKAQLPQAGDVPHYIDIAREGYVATGENANNIVFFPLFPMLMRLLQPITGDYTLAGMLISNVCLALTAPLLDALVRLDGTEADGLYAVTLMSVYPAGLFMIHAYTESLFMCLAVACLYALRKRKWMLAGLAGMLACLTRSQGIALAVPAVLEWLASLREERLKPAGGLWLALIPSGTGIYLLLNRLIYGSFTAFLGFQAAAPWYNSAKWIADGLRTTVDMIGGYGILDAFIYVPQTITYFVLIGLLLYGFRRRERTSEIAFGGAFLFLTYMHGWMISGVRYCMACLPCYKLAALSPNRWLRYALLLISSVSAVFFAAWYLQGQAIM